MTTTGAAYVASTPAVMGDDAHVAQVRATALSIQRGRVLAALETEEIISKVKRWAQEGRLNRGLRLSVPYYDDAVGEMKWREIDVVPRGRVLFVPAFLVLAVYREARTIERELRLTASTREHLIGLLRTLQRAFGPVPEEFEV